MTVLEGNLVSGAGRAAEFLQLDWVRSQLMELVGIDPFPGTLNLALEDDTSLASWRQWRSMPGQALEPKEAGFCRARCYPVQVAGRIPAAVLLPAVADYPEDRVELVAALPIRRHLALGEAARLRVELCSPLAVRAVLFDLDGTLVDSVSAYIEVARGAAAPFGLKVTGEQVRTALATGGSFWKGIVPEGRTDVDAIAKGLSAHAAREWPRVLREHARLFDGLAQTLDALKTLGIMLGIVSGARPEVLELLRPDGILDRFDAVILGSDVSKAKPDPEGILKCLHQLGVAPTEALYVGDAPIDIQASRAAGVRVASVLTGAGDSAMLSAYGPDRLISSHVRLPAMVASPAAIDH
ncbi:HAD-IA family hydrolase [Geobacter argillaceus]|uniref:phosphoglycolate phosphatase n=1 Tax=Geobacter argillaceus TaxID=345631 RepID=A0A562VJ12_9BACT|nr:HAD-IA family hydrolase [Geobacter argillaceus]TWJ17811.1 phosphoglycolate phosphatase [Geobacter argillaceus]